MVVLNLSLMPPTCFIKAQTRATMKGRQRLQPVHKDRLDKQLRRWMDRRTDGREQQKTGISVQCKNSKNLMIGYRMSTLKRLLVSQVKMLRGRPSERVSEQKVWAQKRKWKKLWPKKWPFITWKNLPTMKRTERNKSQKLRCLTQHPNDPCLHTYYGSYDPTDSHDGGGGKVGPPPR